MTKIELITATILLTSAILGLASAWLSFQKEKIALKVKSEPKNFDQELKH